MSQTHGYVGGTNGPDEARRLRPLYHKLSDIVLYPDCAPPAICYDSGRPEKLQDWYLLAECHISTPGRFMSTGVRVTYEVGGETYQDLWDGIELEVNSGPESPPSTGRGRIGS